jgi:archaellum component FlaC
MKVVEASSLEIVTLTEKLKRNRKRYKTLNATYKELQEKITFESETAKTRIQELEMAIIELQKAIQEKDKISVSTIDDLRAVVDQQKREIERMRISAQEKSLIPSSAQRVVDAPRRGYAPIIPGGKAGA